MVTVGVVPLLCSLKLPSGHVNSSSSSSSPGLICASTSNKLLGRRRRRLEVSSLNVRRRDDEEQSKFMDEDGVVDDMDGYLNYLSPEYESVWDTKPSWCQPWTITVTGVSIVASSWLVLHSVVVTSVIAVLICAWWYIFLYSYPKAYTEMIAERRKRVKKGTEDTFGFTNSQ